MRKRRRRAVLALALAVAASAVAIGWRAHDRGATHAGEGSAGERAAAIDPVTGARRAGGTLAVGGRRVAGVVTLEGAPVAGAMVRTGDVHVATGADGRFDLGPQRSAPIVVVAEKPGLTGAALALDLRDPTVDAEHVSLVLHACDASLHGTIRDVGGGAIAGARLMQSEPGLDAGAGTVAGEDGSYDLCVAVGEAMVRVRAEGYAEVTASIAAYGRVRRDFSLGPEAIVVGKTVRADDHTPVGGAEIELRHDSGESPMSVRTRSEADGQFRIAGLSPGRYVIKATADRLATLQAAHVIAEIGAQDPVTCVLSPAVTVTGKVVERGGGAPVAGASLHLGPHTYSGGTMPGRAVTQRDGSFAFEHVLPGEYEAAVELYELARQPTVTVDNGDVAGVLIEVDALASIAGRITRGGKPVDSAQVQTDGAATRSGPDGRYTLRGLAPGKHRVYAESKRVGAFSKGPLIEVGKAEHRTGVDVELELDAAISGTVVDQDGAAVAGVFLRFSLVHGFDFGMATTADDGSFTATALSGGGDYVYEVRASEVSPIHYHPVEGRRFPPVTVRDGQSRVTGLRIKIRVEHLPIAGRVVTMSGEAVPDVVVRAQPSAGSWPELPSATTDMSGAFTIHDLQAGSYTVRAQSTRGEEHVDNVAAGRKDLVIRLAEPGAIDGTLDGFGDAVRVTATRLDGDPNAYGQPSSYPATIRGNAFILRSLPPGRYVVSAMSDLARASVEATVTAGATAKVAVHGLGGFGTIAGTIVDAAHKPLAGLHCFAMSRAPGDVVSDASGTFVVEKVFSGDTRVACYGDTASARGQVKVVAGQTTHVELVAEAERPAPKLGMELEDQLGQVFVKSVESGGAAERAGMQVGDLIAELDGKAVTNSGAFYQLQSRATVKLALERGDKQLTVWLTVP